MTLRIAIVAACPFPLARGTPVRVLRMAEALRERGHDVHVITYHLGSASIPVSVPVHRIRNVSWYSKLGPGPSYAKLLFVDPMLVRKLSAVLASQRFDVMHAHHYEGTLVAAAARIKHRIPMVYDAHTLLMSELPYYRLGLPKGALRKFGAWMDRGIPRLATHTVCVTDTIRDKLIRFSGMDPQKVSVISNGIEVDEFASAAATAPTRMNSVLFAGNLAQYQGIEYLLNAFARVVSRVPEARLVIASDTSFEAYEKLARELGIRERIDLVDAPPFRELPGLIASCPVAVSPRTDGDGIPVKLLNYMAAGRAVVSFAGAAPGVVHGETGFLAPNGDVGALAEGIVSLLQNPTLARRYGAAARSYIEANCRWSIVAERCEALYGRLLREAA